MKARYALALSVVTTIAAPAQAIDLTCRGAMHTYTSGHIDGVVPPGATIVDLTHAKITSPVGEFHISRISDDSISFDDPTQSQGLTVFGTLDRISGIMQVFWRKPKETSKMSMYADLRCSKGRRLF